MQEIDWSRMHRPQTDGYDTKMILALAAERYQFVKRPPAPGAPSMFGGRLAIIHQKDKAAPYLNHAPFDHPNVAKTDAFLTQVWPEMATQCAEGLQEVYIMLDDRHSSDVEISGCTCGNIAGFGGICTTIQGTIGFAHGIVHEWGHWKLHAMGVHLEDWDNLIANSFDELFDSPIRKDKPRPMGACVQAQYSYLHVLEMEIRAWKAGWKSDMLQVNAGRMTAGRETLKSWKPDANGVLFAAALDAWTVELLDEAAKLFE